MLVPYVAYLYFPGGGLATDYPVTTRVIGSNQPAPIFSDAAGVNPLPNPLVTAPDGLLAFYAAPGVYEARLGHEAHPINIDPSYSEPVWPGVYVHEQPAPAAVWTIDHCFGIEPEVQVIADQLETEAEVAHPTPLRTVITFGAPMAGTAHLRR